MPVVKVTSPSFSIHPTLAAELRSAFPNSVLNTDGVRYQGDALKAYLADADAAIIGLEKVDAALLRAAPHIKMIAKYGVGLDNIDQDACRAANVAVGWTGGVNRRSVAELALCTMLGLQRNIIPTAYQLRAGIWHKSGGRNLSGATVGILGLGCVGQDLVKLLHPFQCTILACDIADRSAFAAAHDVQMVDQHTLFTQSQIISLHTPLTPATQHVVNADTLADMRADAFVINTARGAIVDIPALKEALQNGTIAGAALDVFDVEPPEDQSLIALPNLIATPHIGGNSNEAVLAMGRSAIGHLQQFFS